VTNARDPSSTSISAGLLATKPFFKIGEVARLIGVKPHVLRYWESEFPSLNPRKNPSGQRIYAKADIEAIVEIKNLLYNECYTISGAKKMLTRHDTGQEDERLSFPEKAFYQDIQYLKKNIQALVLLLQRGLE
jgi:DNA-binding transcriptional MerR regulator